MSTNYTQQYQLSLWEPEDKVQRAEFNENHQKIETALKGLKTDKAEQSALDALAGQVAKKAEQTALEGLAKQLSELAAGQFVYKIDTYTGTGEYRYNHPNRIEFPFKPVVVVVSDPRGSVGSYPWIRGSSKGAVSHATSVSGTDLTWEEQALKWYQSSSECYQLYSADIVYTYLAIGLPV